MPGRVPLRVAQLVRMGDITFANVHLSHGQLLNRRQLARIVRRLEGPAAVIGDYNAFGPIILHGFRDVGPRQATHIQQNLLRFRLDRCLVRGLSCVSARTLKKGKSDHRPIVLHLRLAEELVREYTRGSAASDYVTAHPTSGPRRQQEGAESRPAVVRVSPRLRTLSRP